jgi:hypothetical protein
VTVLLCLNTWSLKRTDEVEVNLHPFLISTLKRRVITLVHRTGIYRPSEYYKSNKEEPYESVVCV